MSYRPLVPPKKRNVATSKYDPLPDFLASVPVSPLDPLNGLYQGQAAAPPPPPILPRVPMQGVPPPAPYPTALPPDSPMTSASGMPAPMLQHSDITPQDRLQDQINGLSARKYTYPTLPIDKAIPDLAPRNLGGDARSGLWTAAITALLGGLVGGGRGALYGLSGGGRGAQEALDAREADRLRQYQNDAQQVAQANAIAGQDYTRQFQQVQDAEHQDDRLRTNLIAQQNNLLRDEDRDSALKEKTEYGDERQAGRDYGVYTGLTPEAQSIAYNASPLLQKYYPGLGTVAKAARPLDPSVVKRNLSGAALSDAKTAVVKPLADSVIDTRKQGLDLREAALKQQAAIAEAGLNIRMQGLNLQQQGLELRKITIDAQQAAREAKASGALDPAKAMARVNAINGEIAALSKTSFHPGKDKDGVTFTPIPESPEAKAAKAAAIAGLRQEQDAHLQSLGYKRNPNGKGGFVPLVGNTDTSKAKSPPKQLPARQGGELRAANGKALTGQESTSTLGAIRDTVSNAAAWMMGMRPAAVPPPPANVQPAANQTQLAPGVGKSTPAPLPNGTRPPQHRASDGTYTTPPKASTPKGLTAAQSAIRAQIYAHLKKSQGN